MDAGVFEDICFPDANEEASLKELIDLQTQLHALSTAQHKENGTTRSGLTGFHTPGPSNVSEILVAMERLTGLSQNPSIGDGASASQSESSSPENVKEDDGKNTLLLLLLAMHTCCVCTSPWSHHFTANARSVFLMLEGQMANRPRRLHLSGHLAWPLGRL